MMNKRLTLIVSLILCSIAGISLLASTAYMESRKSLFADARGIKAAPNFERNSRATEKRTRQQVGSPVAQAPRVAAGQTATLLADGSWLLIGGEGSSGPTGAAVVVNLLSGERKPLTGGLQRARAGHSATMLPDGNILIAGGIGPNGRVVKELELFDPESGQFQILPANGLTPRAYHTATLLTDGTVLFVGGVADKNRMLDQVELWDSKTKVVTASLTVLQTARRGHAARLLSNGNVLVEGGINESGVEVSASEQYELTSRSFAPAASITGAPDESPYLADSHPTNGAADVPVDTRIALRFSKPLQAQTINPESVALTGPQGTVEIKTVVAESGRLLFVNPKERLLSNTTYTLSLINLLDATGLPVPGAALTIATVDEHTHDQMPDHDPSMGRGQQPADEDEWIPNESNLQGNWRSLEPDSPAAQLSPLKAENGVTALAGQVLTLKGRPLANVTLQIGNNSARTDETGRFLLAPLVAGTHGLIINGSTASTPNRPFATFDTRVEVKAGHTNVLPYTIWLPIIDTRNVTHIPRPAPKGFSAKTPRIPGLEVQLPAGAVLRHPHGDVLTTLTITPMPVDRPPFPLPAGASNGILFTLQLHGARVDGISQKGDGIRIVYPNFAHLPPGSRVDLWNYDSREVGWYVYGRGTVTPDGRQIVPDPGAELQSMHCATYAGNPGGPGRSPGNCCDSAADPVDLSTGEFEYQKTDLYLPDILPISLTRSFRSNDNNQRAFGIGTTLPFDLFLAGDPYSFLYADLILPDGGRIHYDRISSGTHYSNAIFEHTSTPTAFYKSRMTWNGSLLLWELRLKDGTLLRFGKAEGAKLVFIQDRYGNSLRITRDTPGIQRITKVTSSNGRWIEFTYDGSNRITQAKDNIGRTVGYQYDAGGRLWKVTDVGGGVTEFTYDTSNRILTIKDPRNIVYLTNEYDTSGRVKKQTQADGGIYQFAYTVDANGKITQTDVTDPRNFVRRVTFNASGYTTSNTNAVGTPEQQSITFERQAVTNLVQAVTDPLGRRTTYSYGSQEKPTSITTMADTAAAATTTLTYEPDYNQPAIVTDPLNHTTSYAYDNKGNLISITDALNHQTTFDYNAAGQVIYATDALQHTTQFIYDAGDLVEVRDPLGRSSKRFVDGAGRILNKTDALGRTTVYEYDALNQVKKITDPLQGITSFDYDPNGNLLSVTDARNKLTGYTYNNMDRVETRTDPLLNVESYEYDLAGNLKKYTDRRSKVTRYTYDSLNRPKFIGFGETVNGGTTSYESTIDYTVDAGNRLTQVLDSQAGTITRAYNDLTRTYSETTPQGTVSHTIDAAGRAATMTATGQSVVSYGYDDANRLTSITQGTSSVGFGYDNANRRTSLTLPNGVITTYGYDDASQLTSISYARAGTVQGDLTYEYDQGGRRTKMGGSFARTVSPSSLTSATYNSTNQQTSFANQTLSYDLNGNLTGDGANTYTWNARNQLASINGSVSATFSYDAFGRRTSKSINGAATGYLYDGSNIVQEQAGGAATANMLSAGVDEVFTRSDAAGSWNVLRDGLGSTLALADSSGAVQSEYSYDAFGGTASTGQTSSNTSQYTGRENDGTGLYYYRARYYSPMMQRFISEDPIGFSGGINFYAYVRNNPTGHRDPSGLREDPGEPDRSPVTGGVLSGRKPEFDWTAAFVDDLATGRYRKGWACKTWRERFKETRNATEDAVPGMFAPSLGIGPLSIGLGTLTGTALRSEVMAPSLFQWGRAGFRGMQMGASQFTGLETGLTAGAVSGLNFLLVTGAWEAGVATGSAINATFPGPCDCEN
jgi:RHS repeat-associated protein